MSNGALRTTPHRRQTRQTWPIVAVAGAVLLVIASVTWLVLRPGSGGGSGMGAAGSGASSATGQPAAAAAARSAAELGSTTAFRYLPLWPFATQADGATWQQSYRSGGAQPWHRDAGVTAVSFSKDYLGYANITEVVGSPTYNTAGTEAWVTVGATRAGKVVPAAVVHLAKFGSQSDAPWEAVGTQDTSLTLTTPAYWSSVGSPLTVGGRVTAAGERLHIQVLNLPKRIALTSADPPAGKNAAWSSSITFTAVTGSALTVAVATGTSDTDVDRFSVTGVRVGVGRSAHAAKEGDVDGDGRVDAISLPTSGKLRINYSSGGTDTVSFTPSSGSRPEVLGSVDADTNGHAEVFVRTRSDQDGNAAALFRYVGGHLRLVTLDGEQASLAYGGTTSDQASWACRQPSGAIVTWSGSSSDGSTFPGTLNSYQFDNEHLVQVSTWSKTVTDSSPAPHDCGSIALTK